MPRPAQKERPEHAARHCVNALPYRMIVFAKLNQHQRPLYLVAGSGKAAAGAEKALREAHRLHGGECFYCKEAVAADALSIDHAEPEALGGKEDLQNLLIACKPCNMRKGHKAIEAFKVDAGREWLAALLRQVQERLNRL